MRGVSDFIVRVIPTDPTWQPTEEAAQQTAAAARILAGVPENIYPSVDVHFMAHIEMAHPHENLERVGCHRCGADIGLGWLAKVMGDNPEGGPFGTLLRRRADHQRCGTAGGPAGTPAQVAQPDAGDLRRLVAEADQDARHHRRGADGGAAKARSALRFTRLYRAILADPEPQVRRLEKWRRGDSNP